MWDYLYPSEMHGFTLGRLRAKKNINCFLCLGKDLNHPFWLQCRMKDSHVCLDHCLGPGVFKAIFRNSTLGIRLIRYSAVVFILTILHSTMKFSQNWGVSDVQEGWCFFLIGPLAADCWDCRFGDGWTETIAAAAAAAAHAHAWTVAISTAGLEHSYNRGTKDACYVSFCFR